jgi:branched-chain amino acid transport system ATP-binding protein
VAFVNAEPLLRVERLTRRFGGLVAINDVSFDVRPREIVGVMGANGAGKTTLFSLIAGNARPSSGAIRLEGRNIAGLPPDRVNRLGVARTFQIVRPFAALTVLENVATAVMYGSRRIASRREAEDQARSLLDEVSLLARAGDPAHELTLAGRKRLELARALGTGPRIILLDEILAGLTGAEVAAALDLIRVLHERHALTILIIEHVMRALMRLSDRIVVLHHGCKIADDLPARIAEHPAVLDAYLGTGRNVDDAA